MKTIITIIAIQLILVCTIKAQTKITLLNNTKSNLVLYNYNNGSYNKLADGLVLNNKVVFNVLPQTTKGLFTIWEGKNKIYDFVYTGSNLTLNIAKGNNYSNNLLQIKNMHNAINVCYTNSNPSSEKTNKFNNLLTQYNRYWDSLKTQHNNTLVYTYLLANKEYLPNINNTLEQRIAEVKQQFFVNFNFADTMHCYAPLLQERVKTYISTFYNKETNNKTEQYISLIDDVLQQANIHPKVLDMLANYLWKGFNANANQQLTEYIDVYYLSKSCKSNDDKTLQRRLYSYQNMAIGNIAPSLVIDNNVAQKQKVDNIMANNNTIVIFWATWCSHCKEILPQIKTMVEGSSVNVIAIALDENTTDWQNFIKDYPNWQHIQAKEKWKNSNVENYGVYKTPTVYILDKNRKIIEKPQKCSIQLKNKLQLLK